MATIFKKQSSRPLTNYQKSINAAAVELCLQTPGLLHNRQVLLDTAREKIINEGFQFVKGKSRSKKGQHSQQNEPKRPKQLNQELRDTRLQCIEEMIKDYDERITFKDKRIAACLNVSNFKACDELKDEIIDLKEKKRQLEAEKKSLLLSNRKSKWYYRRKSLTSSDSTCCESSTPISSSNEASSPLHTSGPVGSLAFRYSPDIQHIQNTSTDSNEPLETTTSSSDVSNSISLINNDPCASQPALLDSSETDFLCYPQESSPASDPPLNNDPCASQPALLDSSGTSTNFLCHPQESSPVLPF